MKSTKRKMDCAERFRVDSKDPPWFPCGGQVSSTGIEVEGSPRRSAFDAGRHRVRDDPPYLFVPIPCFACSHSSYRSDSSSCTNIWYFFLVSQARFQTITTHAFLNIYIPSSSSPLPSAFLERSGIEYHEPIDCIRTLPHVDKGIPY